MRRELRPVVTDDHAGSAPSPNDSRQFPRHAVAGNRGVGNGSQALMGDIINDVQNPEPPAIGHLVMHEVE